MARVGARAPTIRVMNKREAHSVCVGELDDCTATGSRRAAAVSHGPEDRGEIVLCPACLPRIAKMLDGLLETPNWLTIPSSCAPD